MTDTTTQGNWKGIYGTDGSNIINHAANYPSYAQVSVTGQNPYTWSSSTSDVRALQKATSSTDRIAACWYSFTNFTIDQNLTDGNSHQVGIYALDWDGNNSRQARIEILDAGTNALLDSRDITAYSSGKFLLWDLRGHVKVKGTHLAPSGSNAVISGIFFDPTRLQATGVVASNTYPGNEASLAIDGNPSTTWVANGFPTQWIRLDLGQACNFSRLRLLVAQTPSGATTHQIYGGATSDNLTLLGSLSGTTQSGQLLEFNGSANNVRYIQVTTTSSPSWVGWSELKVYGSTVNSNAGVQWLVTDQLGTPRMIVDQTAV